MPRLACRSCGRQIYATAPLESLFAEERRCPRCGSNLNQDRRDADRRLIARRVNPPDEPGPPASGERRVAARRQHATRRRDSGRTSSPVGSSAGWVD
ncbi:MAG TPA: hypothetical protein VKR24_05090 [Candidatus Limnocylindrales bacterium]|nr:hypothetical protein [Candidatus Limnocylindrales bacterium]